MTLELLTPGDLGKSPSLLLLEHMTRLYNHTLAEGGLGSFIFFFASVYFVLNLVLIDSLLLEPGIWGFLLIKSMCYLVQATEKSFYKYA